MNGILAFRSIDNMTSCFRISAAALIGCVLLASSCGTATPESGPTAAAPTALGDVPAVRLNFRYEADVPAPPLNDPAPEELNAAVRDHFTNTRPDDILDRTVASPDKNRIAAVYHRPGDLSAEFRLDIYSSDGKLLSKVTPDNLAVHFPDTIVWSPDSANLAFAAMIRGENGDGTPEPGASPSPSPTPEPVDGDATEPQATPETTPTPAGESTPTPPTGVLAFRTEQIYLCDANGGLVRPLTQNEGLLYFYYAWAPDSSALVALAATIREWQYLESVANDRGEAFTPVGRPRMIEKNGRERRLDDGLTAVKPVWSPDSSKIAAAFEHQIRIYDADGSPPTQASIPLRNSLLLSSQEFDRRQGGDAPEQNTNLPGPTTLPDPTKLVSFNPIVSLNWEADQILNFQTAFIKRMANQAENVFSFARWHRVILSPQAAPAAR